MTAESEPAATATASESDTLHTTDVIELQAFLERKTWIDAQIHTLEQLPPLDPFINYERLAKSSDPIDGLPDRVDVARWIVEVDDIMAETEKFDQGDMNRLKEFTKTKSQQNLSPEDTDLIEVTLTTLLSLEKLMHLLRIRSEVLDVMNLRLDWEEQRLAVWSMRADIIAQLRDFSTKSAWSTAIYDASAISAHVSSTSVSASASASTDSLLLNSSPRPSPALPAPTASSSSKTPESIHPQILSSPARSYRHSISTNLTSLTSSISSSLRTFHKDVLPVPAVTLDRMIEVSTKKVPDILLDEQDRLEDESRILGSVGGAVGGVGMQWRKADEYFAELKKDSAMAEIILEDILAASLSAPSLVLAQSFTTRAQSLSSRLSAIGLPSTIVPRPRHPLFPNQLAQNESVHATLSEELAGTMARVRSAMEKAKEYAGVAGAFDRASGLCTQAEDLSAQLGRIAERIRNGSSGSASEGEDGDGVPPDLSDEKCLDPNRHGAYMAFLPSLFGEISTIESSAKEITTSLRLVLLELAPSPALSTFCSSAHSTLDSLADRLASALEAKRQAMENVDALRRARGVHSRSIELRAMVLSIKEEISEAIDLQQWKASLGGRAGDEAPLTPESARSLQLHGGNAPGPEEPVSPGSLASRDVRKRIGEMERMLDADVRKPLNGIVSSLGATLLHFLENGVKDIASQLETLRHMADVLERVQRQAEAMGGAISESYVLEARIDSLRMRIQGAIDDTLADPAWVPGSMIEAELGAEVGELQGEIGRFTSGLSSRVPLVSFAPTPSTSLTSLHILDESPRLQDTLQRKMTALDQIVRSDVNSLAMNLGGRVDSLKRKLGLYNLADLARLMDQQTESASQAIIIASTQLSSLSSSTAQLIQKVSSELPAAPGQEETPDLRDDFAQILSSLDSLASEHITSINQACSTALITLRQMRSSPGARDSSVHDDILPRRTRSFEDVESRAYAFQQELGALKARAIEGRRLAENKLHEEKLRREREEMERRGSLTQAELEASKAALRESEAKALAAAEERKRMEEEQARRDVQARLDDEARAKREAREAAERMEEAQRREAELRTQEEERRAEELRRTEEAARKAEAERLALAAAHKLELEEAARAAEAAAIAAANAAREADLFNSPPVVDPETAAILEQISDCRALLRSIGIALAAKPEFESIDDAVSPLPTVTEAQNMRSRFDEVSTSVVKLASETKDDKVVGELKSLKIELEASRVLLSHVDFLAAFSHKVEICDAALSDLLEHSDTFPDQPSETMSPHIPDFTKSPVDQLQDRLDYCEREVDSLHTTFAMVGDDERALGERVRVMEMWDDVSDTARQQITAARAASAPMSKTTSASRSRPSMLGLPTRSPALTTRSLHRDKSPSPFIVADSPRIRAMSSTSSLKKAFITPESGRTRLRPQRSRSPSKSSIRSVSGPASGTPSKPPGGGPFKVPAIPSRPQSQSSARSVSGPLPSTPTTSRYTNATHSSRQRTISTTDSIRSAATPSTPKVVLPSRRLRGSSSAATPTIPRSSRASSPTLSTVSNTSSGGSHSPVKHIRPRLSSRVDPTTPRARTQSQLRKSTSAANLVTPRPLKVRQKKEYVANPKNRLDVAVGAVVNKLPANVTIEPVLDTWKDESGKYWIGDAEPKLCFCRILRSQTVMVRVGGGWMELSKFIRLHYSHLFRVDTLTTPPKNAPGSTEERWISSSTLREEEGDGEPRSTGSPSIGGSTSGWSPPIAVLRTPIISATSSEFAANRRSPTPNFLRESSPSAGSSPLTPLHYIRRASIEPGLSPTPSGPMLGRERSPGLSSDGGSVRGGGSVAGSTGLPPVRPRPRVSASGTPARSANGPTGPQKPRWR